MGEKKVLNDDEVLPGKILQKARKFSGVAGNVESLEESVEADLESKPFSDQSSPPGFS